MPLRKPRARYHSESLVRINTEVPSFESYKIPDQTLLRPILSRDSAQLKAYPRVLRNRQRVDHLEVKLQVDTLRELDGLTKTQREPLLKIIDKNAEIRQMAGLEPGVFEEVPDDMYNYAIQFGPLIKPEEEGRRRTRKNTTGFETDTGVFQSRDTLSRGLASRRMSLAPSRGTQRSRTASMKSSGGDLQEELSKIQQTLSQSMVKIVLDDIEPPEDDLFDVEFPIEEYVLQSSKQEEEGEDELENINRYVRMHTQHKEIDYKKLYSQLASSELSGGTKGSQQKTIDASASNVSGSGRNDLEHIAMQQMKQVSIGLQQWIVDVLDNSIQIDPQILEEVNAMQAAESEQSLDSSTNTREKDHPAFERVDISGFDVLLNACKPSILEAKPAVRLNVVHEINPPDTLVNTLQKNLGMSLEEKRREALARQKKILPAVESSFTYKKKVVRPRPHYGAWYVPPKLWNKVMAETAAAGKKPLKAIGGITTTEAKRRVGGIVQEKLEQIARKRELEQERFMKELEAASGINAPSREASRGGAGSGNGLGGDLNKKKPLAPVARTGKTPVKG